MIEIMIITSHNSLIDSHIEMVHPINIEGIGKEFFVTINNNMLANQIDNWTFNPFQYLPIKLLALQYYH